MAFGLQPTTPAWCAHSCSWARPSCRRRHIGRLLGALARTVPYESLGELPAVPPAYTRAGPCELARYLRSALQDKPEQVMPRVVCPVWVIRGRHDAFAPHAWTSDLVAVCRRATALTVPGSHDFPYWYSALTAVLIAHAARQG